MLRSTLASVSFALSLLLLQIHGSAAQDLKFNIAVVEGCVAASQDRHNCIGLSANLCQTENEGGSSTVGMGFCISEELSWWDLQLNQIYKKWVNREKELDAEAKSEGWNTPERMPALKEMQRTWIKYRDAMCEHEAVQWGGGTGTGPAYLGCLLSETGRQYLLLEDRWEGYTNN